MDRSIRLQPRVLSGRHELRRGRSGRGRPIFDTFALIKMKPLLTALLLGDLSHSAPKRVTDGVSVIFLPLADLRGRQVYSIRGVTGVPAEGTVCGVVMGRETVHRGLLDRESTTSGKAAEFLAGRTMECLPSTGKHIVARSLTDAAMPDNSSANHIGKLSEHDLMFLIHEPESLMEIEPRLRSKITRLVEETTDHSFSTLIPREGEVDEEKIDRIYSREFGEEIENSEESSEDEADSEESSEDEAYLQIPLSRPAKLKETDERSEGSEESDESDLDHCGHLEWFETAVIPKGGGFNILGSGLSGNTAKIKIICMKCHRSYPVTTHEELA